jgi:hypothetical protein
MAIIHCSLLMENLNGGQNLPDDFYLFVAELIEIGQVITDRQ